MLRAPAPRSEINAGDNAGPGLGLGQEEKTAGGDNRTRCSKERRQRATRRESAVFRAGYRMSAPLDGEAGGQPAAVSRLRLLLPHLSLLLSVALLGFSFVGIRTIMSGHDAPASLGFLRDGLATLFLLPFVALRPVRLPPPGVLLTVLLLGAIQFGVFHLLVNTALQDIPASRGAVIFSLIPILTMLIATLSGRDTLNGIRLLAALLSVLGVSLAIGENAFDDAAGGGGWTGELLFFIAVFCGATYNAFSSRLMQNRSVVLLTVIGMGAGTLTIFPFAYAEGLPAVAAAYSLENWLWILFLAIPAAAVSLLLFNWGLQQLSPSKAAIYVPIAPIIAAASGALILGEHLSSLFLIGLACAVLGPLLVNWRR